MGDNYYGARSNEFGYANYEILPKPPLFINPLGKSESEGVVWQTFTPHRRNKTTWDDSFVSALRCHGCADAFLRS